jgi:hypothetical protein
MFDGIPISMTSDLKMSEVRESAAMRYPPASMRNSASSTWYFFFSQIAEKKELELFFGRKKLRME